MSIKDEIGSDDGSLKPIRAKEPHDALPDRHSVGGPVQSERCGVLDEAELLERVDGDRVFLNELIELFIALCPELMTAIRDAITRDDADGLNRASHVLKGSVSNFSAPAAVEAALRLEIRGRAGNLVGAQEDYRELENAIGNLQMALRSLADETECGEME